MKKAETNPKDDALHEPQARIYKNIREQVKAEHARQRTRLGMKK